MYPLQEDDHRDAEIQYLERGGDPSAFQRATLVNTLGNLRVTVGALPPGQSLWTLTPLSQRKLWTTWTTFWGPNVNTTICMVSLNFSLSL